ncbi:unnamed protein product, partial [Coregonus sp. 'balchen']
MGPFDKDLMLKVEVWDEDPMVGGGFYFLYTFTCDPHLTGDQCEKYKPSNATTYKLSTPTVHSTPLYSKSKHLFSIQSSALLYLWLFYISVEDCLSTGLGVGLGRTKVSSSDERCSKVLDNRDSKTSYSSGFLSHHTKVVGGSGRPGELSLNRNDSVGFHSWMSTLKDYPDAISYSLRPLYLLIPDKRVRERVKRAPENRPVGALTLNWTQTAASEASKGTLAVTVNKAWGLAGDWFSGVTHSYAVVQYGTFRTKPNPVIESCDPVWNTDFNMGHVDTTLKLTVEVWDQDMLNDDLLGGLYHPPPAGDTQREVWGHLGRHPIHLQSHLKSLHLFSTFTSHRSAL